MGEGEGIGWAVKQMQNGSRVRRAGWNGKGMFVFLVPASEFTVNRAPLLGIYPEGTVISYRAHIDIKNVDGSISTWAPSNGDTLPTTGNWPRRNTWKPAQTRGRPTT